MEMRNVSKVTMDYGRKKVAYEVRKVTKGAKPGQWYAECDRVDHRGRMRLKGICLRSLLKSRFVTNVE